MGVQNETPDAVIKALIYSKFENIGPLAIAWYPAVDEKFLSAIALKSINLFSAEEGKVPESISVIPFSFVKRIGIVKCFEIPDPNARGRARDATLTLLIDEDYNHLILRFIDDLDKLMNNITGRILVNEQINAGIDEIQKVVTESFTYIIDNIEVFQALAQDRAQSEPKMEQLKEMIAEIELLIEDYIRDMDQFGTNEVKDVLRLAWDIKQLDLYDISPEEIRQIFELANRLKLKKESISVKKTKLRQYKAQMSSEITQKLNQQIDAISKNLDKVYEKLLEIVEELAKRSEMVIETQSKMKKKASTTFIFHRQFTKVFVDLKQKFDLFRQIERLPPKQYQMVKETYILLEKMRTIGNRREVGKAVNTIAALLNVDRTKILEVTRDLEMKDEFNKIFQL